MTTILYKDGQFQTEDIKQQIKTIMFDGINKSWKEEGLQVSRSFDEDADRIINEIILPDRKRIEELEKENESMIKIVEDYPGYNFGARISELESERNTALNTVDELKRKVIDHDVKRVKCDCICHTPGLTIMHIAACCDNGWIYPSGTNNETKNYFRLLDKAAEYKQRIEELTAENKQLKEDIDALHKGALANIKKHLKS